MGRMGRRRRLRRQRRWTTLAVGVLAASLAWGTQAAPATADPVAQAQGRSTRVPADPGPSGTAPAAPDKVGDPARDLAPGWRTAKDRTVALVGDAAGLHLLAARSSDAYQWHELAVLRREGIDTDKWIGNVCVTGSGERAFVTYAPREFTNTEALSDNGGFTAVVDLGTGRVTQLPVTSALDYYSPGCGTGESAVFTQAGFTRNGRTRLVTVDGASGKVTDRSEVQGQVTSAVPVQGGVVAARNAELLRLPAGGAPERLAKTRGSALRIVPDAQGGVQFLQAEKEEVKALRWGDGKVRELASGKLGEVGLARGTAGRVFLTGTPAHVTASLPASTRRVKADARAVLSSEGRLAVTEALTGAPPADAPDEPAPARIKAVDTGTGRSVDFTVPTGTVAVAPAPEARQGAAPKARLGGDTGSSPVDGGAKCAVPRNDVGTQVYQPTPNQVEWAADLAVRNLLTDTLATRSANWKQTGMGAAWSPQGLFPSIPLAGPAAAGKRVPAQIVLGVLAQESNMWQASKHTLPGQYGNPLVGNYYGLKVYDGDSSNDWDIDWNKVDCGYGVGQVTDGMRTDSTMHTAFQKRAIAVDYATNVARAVQILQGKWNELHNLPTPMTVNNDDPLKLENWYLALWNYNLGFNAPGGTPGSEQWGMGWLNNPANPKYPIDRAPFLFNNHYADAATPQNWPYQEKVLGWAAWPIDTGRSYDDYGVQNSGNTHGYQAAWWSTVAARATLAAPKRALCEPTVNSCDPYNIPDCPDEACYRKLWWTAPISWKDCATECGNETMTYKTKLTEPGDGQLKVAPSCSSSVLPPGALIVDDVPAGSPALNCSKNWTSAGTFEFSFERDPLTGEYPARIDLHQLGNVGFGSHTWFGHTRKTETDKARKLGITGTWRLNNPTNAWTRIMVHLPNTAAHTQQATYLIDVPGQETPKARTIPTRHRANTWVNLGVFDLRGSQVPRVRLASQTADGTGDDDVAWDAMAFVPLAGKPKDFVVSLGDSYSSGEGAEGYSVVSDNNFGNRDWNACHRSKNAWPRKMTLPGNATAVGQRADTADPTLDFAFVACAGATTRQMTVDNPGGYWTAEGWHFNRVAPEGQFRELAQLNSGFLDENTTLVTLSIGGNDADFTGVITTCIMSGCPSEDALRDKIDRVFPCQDSGPSCTPGGPEKVIRRIHQLAPNARIELVGYPRLVKASADTCSKIHFIRGDVERLTYAADRMALDQLTLANKLRGTSGIPVRFIDVIPAFDGHGICDSEEWLNAVVVGPQSEGDFAGGPGCIPETVFTDPLCISRESLHPLKLGTTGYAQAVSAGMAATG